MTPRRSWRGCARRAPAVGLARAARPVDSVRGEVEPQLLGAHPRLAHQLQRQPAPLGQLLVIQRRGIAGEDPRTGQCLERRQQHSAPCRLAWALRPGGDGLVATRPAEHRRGGDGQHRPQGVAPSLRSTWIGSSDAERRQPAHLLANLGHHSQVVMRVQRLPEGRVLVDPDRPHRDDVVQIHAHDSPSRVGVQSEPDGRRGPEPAVRRFLSIFRRACPSFRPPAASHQRLHPATTRLFTLLAGSRKSDAIWYEDLWQSPKPFYG